MGKSQCRRMKNARLTSAGRENVQGGTGTADGELQIRRSIRTLHKNERPLFSPSVLSIVFFRFCHKLFALLFRPIGNIFLETPDNFHRVAIQ